jgi:branched-chain amino acid transport system permease protein
MTMLQYVIAGLVLGGIYAISASGLVVTYLSAGILNFAFGAVAYFLARFYYYLHTQQHWGIAPAAVVSVVICGPALGVLLYQALFRWLRLASPLVKVVTTLGLSVMLPPLATLAFGDVQILQAPGLAPQPVQVFHVDGVPITMNQIIVYACVVAVVVIGAVVLRATDIGLRVRAMVDSPAMTSLSGTSPTAVSVGVWAVSIFLAGLAGVLSAPVVGLDANDFTLIMASAFAAVIAARLRNLPLAVGVALFMGIADSVLQRYLPASSSITQAILPSIPFAVTAVFLVAYLVRGGRVHESEGTGGALDRAIAVQSTARRPTVGSGTAGHRTVRRPSGLGAGIAAIVVVVVLTEVLGSLWVGLIAGGVAYGVLFLAFTLVTGEGGMVWLCIPTFAGIGGLVCGQLAGAHGWPVLAGVVVGGLVAVPFGIVIGLATIRLGDLYVALVTLTFGLLMENLVFSRPIFLHQGLGVSLSLPSFASSPRAFTFVELGIFVVIGLFIVNIRRSTTGMALTAVRWSEPGAKTSGVSVLKMKVITAALAAFVAGVGGALFAVVQGVALPSNYDTLLGVAWLAVVVLVGIRSNVAALIAGLFTTLFPGIAQNYLPAWFQQIPPILFGLGAIGIAKNPDGMLAEYARQLRRVVERTGARWRPLGADRPGTPSSDEPLGAARVLRLEDDGGPDVGASSPSGGATGTRPRVPPTEVLG